MSLSISYRLILKGQSSTSLNGNLKPFQSFVFFHLSPFNFSTIDFVIHLISTPRSFNCKCVSIWYLSKQLSGLSLWTYGMTQIEFDMVLEAKGRDGSVCMCTVYVCVHAELPQFLPWGEAPFISPLTGAFANLRLSVKSPCLINAEDSWEKQFHRISPCSFGLHTHAIHTL